MSDLVTVFGGTGFLGRHVVARLVAEGFTVRVAVRRPAEAAVPKPGDGPGDVLPIRADVRDEASTAAAVEGARAVVNAVGLYVEKGGETFEAVHVRGAERVARLASRAGVAQLVQISGIGADTDSPSAYVRARAEGDGVVGAAFEDVVILRPSVLFGPGDAFFTSLAAMARVAPVWPLFGRGETRLQPVFVGDVAEAVAKVVAGGAPPGGLYELGGPDIFTYRELIEVLLKQLGLRRPLLPVPFALWHLLAAALSVLPNPPVTRDQLALVARDNLVASGARSFRDLDIAPRSVHAVLPTYVGAGRRT